jgi:ribonuclease HI
MTAAHDGAGSALRLHTDGASRGNPGPAAIGVVIARVSDGRVIEEISAYLGEATNNVAEYQALIAGLRRAAELGASAVEVVSDSELLVRQVEGRYQVRHPGLIPLHEEVRRLKRRFAGGFHIRHTLRGGNARADELANLAIDGALGARQGRAPHKRAQNAAGAVRRSAGERGRDGRPAAAGADAPPAAGGGRDDLVVDAFALARTLDPGSAADLGGGMRVVRLAPGQSHASAWALVLHGTVEVGGRMLGPGQCCRGAARYRAANAAEAVVLEGGAGM